MSKAFTKEADDGGFDEIIPEPKDLLPPGVKNYVTPEGAELLRAELERLESVVRPQVAKKGNGSAGKPVDGSALSQKSRLHAIDRRIQFLRDRVANMVLVDPKTQDQESVHFGATVLVADRDGNEKTYKIVGIDESEPTKGYVSFISPVAKALTSARIGDVVRLELPTGTSELEVLEIHYL